MITWDKSPPVTTPERTHGVFQPTASTRVEPPAESRCQIFIIPIEPHRELLKNLSDQSQHSGGDPRIHFLSLGQKD